ncbi:MAG: hypothetical protein EA375_03300 [Acholeplasmataceae bacterium]|nr:MAG: hypothetical protein EA375_03300 [Acholeplasmataceae bacterium]
MKKDKKIRKRQRWMKKYFKKLSGREKKDFDQMTHDDHDKVIERAQKLLRINDDDYPDVAPIMITVPDAFTKYDKVTYRLDIREDGSKTLHYDQALITTLFFGPEMLFYHQVNVDHRDGRFAEDHVGEFRYADVVLVETSLKYDNPDRPKYIILDLEVKLASGTAVLFHLRNHRLHEDYDMPELLTDQEQHILDQFQYRIRDKR